MAANLSTLSPLDVESAAQLLKARWARERPYTGASDESRVVVAVNPLREIKGLRGEAQWSAYDDKENHDDDNHQHAEEAHVYAVSSGAMKRMKQGRRRQAVIVSGDSGAGKTETSKILLEHFARRKGENSECINRILAANPILEAFGNASTASNHNSSRFGKLLSLGFDNDGLLISAECRTFLFERSRVTNRLPSERNFHIFYQLLAGLARQGPRMKQSMGILGCDEPDDFVILRTDAQYDRDHDFKEASKTLRALSCLEMSPPERNLLYKALCAILHLGNIDFCLLPTANGADIDPDTRIHAAHASRLLGMGGLSLLESALCERAVSVRGEGIVMRNSIAQAAQARDALCSELYFRTFQWIVQFVNVQSNQGTIASQGVSSKVALLDVMGFEVQQTNSLEQLLINYANERLQHLFEKQMVISVQDELMAEGFLDVCSPNHFKQDEETLRVFENPSKGILALLEQECFVPGGSDAGFVRKLGGTGSKNIHVGRLLGQTSFIIKHFAGEVEYNSERFMEKNLSALPRPIAAFVERSPLATFFLPEEQRGQYTVVMASPVRAPTKAILSDKTNLRQQKENEKINSPSMLGRAVAQQQKQTTVGMRFRGELDALMRVIESSDDVGWIRCIRPNAVKDPELFDLKLVQRQLQASGVIAAVTLARQILPVSMRFEAFHSRFDHVLNQVNVQELRYGRTKVYMPGTTFDALVNAERAADAATMMQSVARMFVNRRVYRRRVAAVKRIRAMFVEKAISSLQANVRIRLQAAQNARAENEENLGLVSFIEEIEEEKVLVIEHELSSISSSSATLQANVRIRLQAQNARAENEENLGLESFIEEIEEEKSLVIEHELSSISSSSATLESVDGNSHRHSIDSESDDASLSAAALEALKVELENKQLELERTINAMKAQERAAEELRDELERMRTNLTRPIVYLNSSFNVHKFTWKAPMFPWRGLQVLTAKLLLDFQLEGFVVRRPRRLKIGLAPGLNLLEAEILFDLKVDFATKSGRTEITQDWALDQLELDL